MAEYEEEEEDELFEEESGAYSHMGGRLSGRGMAYDPPDVAESMIKSFQNHPEILSAYVQGRVVNKPSQPLQRFVRPDTALATNFAVDYGGSMNSISHSVNGYLVTHDDQFPHEFHINFTRIQHNFS